MRIKFSDLPHFERGYFEACFFTSDDNAPGGMDYRDTGRPEDLFDRVNESNIAKQIEDCQKFQEQNAALLAQPGDSEQNGMDFWYTRNHHGVGFWDRGYPDEISKPLTDAAHKFGEVNCFMGSVNCFTGSEEIFIE